MKTEKQIKKERQAIYFDCILGGSLSIMSITAIIIRTFQVGISDLLSYVLSLGFWIFVLGVASLLIYVGIHTYYLEKKYPEGIPTKKPVKTPFVS